MSNNTILSLYYYPILFSLSLFNLFKENIHSFFTFTTTTTITDVTTIGDDYDDHYKLSGLGLVTATRDVHRPPNVLESATLLKPNNPPPPPPPPPPPSSRIGFIDDIGGGVDGLMSCTESLGFESSDEWRRIDDDNGLLDKIDDDKSDDNDDDEVLQRRMMRAEEGRGNYWRKKVRSFPPPLSSLNRNGKPSFFLRPVRKDGRLELTEVRIQRSEILHASRHDGRLTLHLIPDQSFLEDEEEIISEEEEEEEIISEVKEEEEEEERVAEWRFPVGGKEGIKRCHEMVNQHHHHHHHDVHANHHHHHLRMCGISIV